MNSRFFPECSEALHQEPEQAFPYLAPSEELLKKFSYLGECSQEIRVPFLKLVFDKVSASCVLFLCLPVLLILLVLNGLEGIVFPENRGPLFFHYYAVSRGKVFPKYKIRLIKNCFVDHELAKKGDWHAYQNEWNPEARTYIGSLVKKFYLDEIPQFYNVLRGDMSIVGPRPIAIHHYERDLAQGNVTRKLIRGGLLGYGHVRKGTSEFGKPIYEFEYLDHYIKDSVWKLFCLDLWIIWKGACVVVKGGGH